MLLVAHGGELLLLWLDELRCIGALATAVLGLHGGGSSPVHFGLIGAVVETVVLGARLDQGDG